jgi:hypothetical protein
MSAAARHTFVRLHVSAQIAGERELLQADIAAMRFIACKENKAPKKGKKKKVSQKRHEREKKFFVPLRAIKSQT